MAQGFSFSASSQRPGWPRWILRGLLLAFVLVAGMTIYLANQLLTERFTETTRNRAELRLALYSGNLLSELQRNQVMPLLLSQDPALAKALSGGDYSMTSQQLIRLQSELGTASILLLDSDGRAVAATDRNRIGTNHKPSPYFLDAQRSRDTIFTATRREAGGFAFTFSRAIQADARQRGVIVVEVDMMKFERAWAGFTDAVAVLDSDGTVLLATEPRWRGLPLNEALTLRDPPTAIERALRATTDWTGTAPDAYVKGAAVLQSEARVPFRGWRIVSYTRYDSVRERVNAFLALVIMGFALLLAGGFYLVSRRARSQTRAMQRESAELRLLNARLSREIAERERMQKDLAEAEQTLMQSSKLAVLGEMSASVSHELNQPLAAMKTYLAGARLLLQRRKTDEALASFQRIDDLIDRMGAITRQFKSFARKGGEAFEEVDFRACVGAALSIMEPQFKQRRLRLTRNMPRTPVVVMADRIRLEQVIINLLRNALDATSGIADPRVELTLTAGEFASFQVSDNGPGIANPDKLFEPFYTTKKPGEGTGLGLAISLGIAADHGGRLSARNGEGGGAVFELRLPLFNRSMNAAE
jgi:two-component system C4-dicarboxylate transport sensor histidine kinase DctB